MKRGLLVALPVVVVACFHDFDAFDPVGGAGDGGAPGIAEAGGGEDASSTHGLDGASPSVDASGCGVSCRVEATSCAGTCAQVEQSCAAACTGDGGACIESCASKESACTSQCVTSCETCTSGEGCIDPAGCKAAAP